MSLKLVKLTPKESHDIEKDFSEKMTELQNTNILLYHCYQLIQERFVDTLNSNDIFEIQGLRKELGNRVVFDFPTVYDTTPAVQAEYLVSAIKRHTPEATSITEATAGVGGCTLALAKCFSRINEVELNPDRARFLRHNCDLLLPYIKSNCHVDVYHGDYTTIYDKLKQDVVYMDPPWGLHYKKIPKMRLSLSDIAIDEIVRSIARYTRYVAVRVPINFDFVQFINGVGETHEIMATEAVPAHITHTIHHKAPHYDCYMIILKSRFKSQTKGRFY